MQTSSTPPPATAPPPIDRRLLRSELRTLATIIAKIATDRLRAFLKENEIRLPMPGLVLSQGLRLILLSKADAICELPDAELRNVLRLIEWHTHLLREPSQERAKAVALATVEPAMRASIARVLGALTGNDPEPVLATPEEAPLTQAQLRQLIEYSNTLYGDPTTDQ